MLEAEVAEALRSLVEAGISQEGYTGEFTTWQEATLTELPGSENAGFIATLFDGAKYLVTVTCIEEGQ